jgi:hypothetical protein
MMSKTPDPAVSRRRIFAGAGAVGAVAAVSMVLPGKPAPVATAEVARPDAGNSGGYQLTQHVLRYYQTAKV